MEPNCNDFKMQIVLTFLILAVSCLPTNASVGGHDLFTSLAQLEVLWTNEMKVVDLMENAIKKMESASNALKGYVRSHKELNLDHGPNYEFLGNPINAYHFVRHVAAGWKRIQDHVVGEGGEALLNDLAQLKDREEEKLPDEDDVKGAAYGLARLRSLYTFDMKSFVKEGVISTTMDNGQIVLSNSSILRLNSYDLHQIATESCDAQLYDSCTDFFQACLDVGKNEKPNDNNVAKFFTFQFDEKHVMKLLDNAKQVHDHNLDKIGEKSKLHRCHKLPFNAKLKKKKKFKKLKEMPVILGRDKLQEIHENDADAEKIRKFVSEKQKDELCRGKELRPLAELGLLKCFYGHNNSPWLKIGPFKIEENALDPYHVTIHQLLYDHECNNITEFLGPMLDFPPGRMNFKTARNDWTMKNCWPNEAQNINLQKLNTRIEHIAGLNANSFKNYSEPYMCGNYGIGGHYWIHPDYHFASEKHYHPMSSGNRVATILTILENPIAGGATVWPYAGISVFGKKGAALFWHNIFSSDIPDTYTRHVACPVLLGQKWIGNKWVGYNAQWNGRKCLLNPYDTFKPIQHFQKF